MFLAPRHLVALCVVFFIVVALVSATRILPYVDEGMLFSPARNLILHGHMGTSIIDTTSELREGASMRGMDKYTYQIMPLHMVTQAVWYKVVGLGLFQMRAFSALCGVLALIAWYKIFSVLGPSIAGAVLAVAFIASDNVFIFSGAFGRSDMLSASLATIGIACYAHFREKQLGRAILFSQFFEAASLFTHPAGMAGVFAVAAIALYLDGRRLNLRLVALAPLPYLLAGGLWGLYILQNPELFKEQFVTHVNTRFGGVTAPFHAVWLELHDRYLEEYGFRAGDGLAARSKVIVLLLYFAAPVLVYFTKTLRERPGVKALLLIVIANAFVFTIFEGTKQQFYLVHVLPILEGLLAIWIVEWWSAQPKYRLALAAILVVFVGGHLSRIASFNYKDRLHTDFDPVVEYLKQNTQPSQLIMGTGELAFGLGFDANLVDDHRLGYITGKKADVIVINERYQELIERLRTYKPEMYPYVKNLLKDHFEKRYDRNNFQVYFRSPS